MKGKIKLITSKWGFPIAYFFLMLLYIGFLLLYSGNQINDSNVASDEISTKLYDAIINAANIVPVVCTILFSFIAKITDRSFFGIKLICSILASFMFVVSRIAIDLRWANKTFVLVVFAVFLVLTYVLILSSCPICGLKINNNRILKNLLVKLNNQNIAGVQLFEYEQKKNEEYVSYNIHMIDMH